MTSPAAPNAPTSRRRFFADLSVTVKILTAVAVAAIVALIVGINGMRSLSAASDSAQLIYRSNVASVDATGRIAKAATQARVDAANQALSSDTATSAKFTQAFQTDLEMFSAAMTAYREGHPAGDADTIANLERTWTTYSKVVQERMLPAGAKHDTVTWIKIRDTETLPLLKEIYEEVEALDAAEQASAAKNAAAAESNFQSSRTTSLIVLVIGLLIATALGVLVARKIVQSLAKVQGRMRRPRRRGPDPLRRTHLAG